MIIIRSFLLVGFLFQYQFINLVWLSFDFFWSLTICFFVVLCSCVCSCPDNVTNFLLLLIIQILVLVYNQPVLFAQLEKVYKLWNNNLIVHVNERNLSENKSQARHIQIDHEFCNSI